MEILRANDLFQKFGPVRTRYIPGRGAMRVFLTTAAFTLTAGCAAPSPSPEPVAVARLAVNRVSVPPGAPVDVTIQFDVAPSFEPLAAAEP